MANKRLDIIKSAIADRNEGSKSPFLNTERGRSYRGKTNGIGPRSGKGGDGSPLRAGGRKLSVGEQKTNDAIRSGKLPLLPDNTIGRKERQSTDKVPYQSEGQLAEVESRFRDYQLKKMRDARKKADKKRLGKGYNGSAPQSLLNGRNRFRQFGSTENS